MLIVGYIFQFVFSCIFCFVRHLVNDMCICQHVATVYTCVWHLKLEWCTDIVRGEAKKLDWMLNAYGWLYLSICSFMYLWFCVSSNARYMYLSAHCHCVYLRPLCGVKLIVTTLFEISDHIGIYGALFTQHCDVIGSHRDSKPRYYYACPCENHWFRGWGNFSSTCAIHSLIFL